MSSPRPRSAGARSPRGVRIPQQARSRRTRERILRAAITCFETRGYDASTTSAIAEAAGIGVGTFYGYFTDKRAVLLELLDSTVREIADHVVEGLDPALWLDADPQQKVRGLIDAIFHTRTISPGLQRILWERYFSDKEFRSAVMEIEAKVRTSLEMLFAALRESGRLRVDDVHSAAFVVYMAIEWTATRLMLGDSDADPDAAVEAASEMIWRYLF